jgi:hypothetical protein
MQVNKPMFIMMKMSVSKKKQAEGLFYRLSERLGLGVIYEEPAVPEHVWPFISQRIQIGDAELVVSLSVVDHVSTVLVRGNVRGKRKTLVEVYGGKLCPPGNNEHFYPEVFQIALKRDLARFCRAVDSENVTPSHLLAEIICTVSNRDCVIVDHHRLLDKPEPEKALAA